MSVPQAADATRRLHLSPQAAFLLVVGVLLAGVSVLTWATHEVYEGVTAGRGVGALDHPALRFALDHRTAALTALAVGFTELVGRIGTPLMGLVALAAFTWRRRDWTPLAYLALITVSARWARGLVAAVCVAVPLCVGLSRVSLGQH